MKKRIIAFVIVLHVSVLGRAASVNWVHLGSATYQEGTGNILKCSWHDEGLTIYPYLEFRYERTDGGVNVRPGAMIMESMGAWYQDDYGAVVGPSTAFGRDLYFAQSVNFLEDFTVVPPTYEIFIPEGEGIFMAFVEERGVWNGADYHTGEYYYGWLVLENIDNQLYAPYSCFDLDGNALYIGGGIAPSSPNIPEPSVGLLLLFGCAALGLRRKIGISPCCASECK